MMAAASDSRKGDFSSIVRDHGWIFGFLHFLFNNVFCFTGWRTARFIESRTSIRQYAIDPSTDKSKPAWQDARVAIGLATTAACVLALSTPALPSIHELAFWTASLHLFGIVVYHLNALLFDEITQKVSEPRAWSFRRIFIQAIINVLEATFLFAAFYRSFAPDTATTFGSALMWELSG
jgi:hypothetical protein